MITWSWAIPAGPLVNMLLSQQWVVLHTLFIYPERHHLLSVNYYASFPFKDHADRQQIATIPLETMLTCGYWIKYVLNLYFHEEGE